MGFALYFTNYSIWRGTPGIYIEDLFVKPTHRGQKYGFALLAAVAEELRKINGSRIEWACLKWNSTALAFYDRLGATQMTEWTGLRLEGDSLKQFDSTEESSV